MIQRTAVRYERPIWMLGKNSAMCAAPTEIIGYDAELAGAGAGRR
jgi:hypothetical protein